MNSQTWLGAVPPTMRARPRLRAGFTEVPVMGMPMGWITVRENRWPQRRRRATSTSFEPDITLVGDLHARPAGALAVAAGRFAAAIRVTAGDHAADAKSVLGVMGLGATRGQ